MGPKRKANPDAGTGAETQAPKRQRNNAAATRGNTSVDEQLSQPAQQASASVNAPHLPVQNPQVPAHGYQIQQAQQVVPGLPGDPRLQEESVPRAVGESRNRALPWLRSFIAQHPDFHETERARLNRTIIELEQEHDLNLAPIANIQQQSLPPAGEYFGFHIQPGQELHGSYTSGSGAAITTTSPRGTTRTFYIEPGAHVQHYSYRVGQDLPQDLALPTPQHQLPLVDQSLIDQFGSQVFSNIDPRLSGLPLNPPFQQQQQQQQPNLQDPSFAELPSADRSGYITADPDPTAALLPAGSYPTAALLTAGSHPTAPQPPLEIGPLRAPVTSVTTRATATARRAGRQVTASQAGPSRETAGDRPVVLTKAGKVAKGTRASMHQVGKERGNYNKTDSEPHDLPDGLTFLQIHGLLPPPDGIEPIRNKSMGMIWCKGRKSPNTDIVKRLEKIIKDHFSKEAMLEYQRRHKEKNANCELKKHNRLAKNAECLREVLGEARYQQAVQEAARNRTEYYREMIRHDRQTLEEAKCPDGFYESIQRGFQSGSADILRGAEGEQEDAGVEEEDAEGEEEDAEGEPDDQEN